MPTYDYRCEANGQVLEVRHRMSENITSWGELCALAGREPGDTDVHSPVTRLATGGQVLRGGAASADHHCSSGACCGGGRCGLPD
ncbi:MAG: zinc ribbon domain-containing protein [Gammaproteobacteria bacterium]